MRFFLWLLFWAAAGALIGYAAGGGWSALVWAIVFGLFYIAVNVVRAVRRSSRSNGPRHTR